jgi:nucleoside-diphosphate-sugar epimerase
MSERFLVTGAYGCIGAWTVRQLIREDAEVIAVDAVDDDRRLRDLMPADELAAVRFVQADIADPAQVADFFALEPTHVIHLAAMQVPHCRSNPVLGAQVNVVGTVALFVAAAAAGVSTPLVYASSVAAFAAADGGGQAPAEPRGRPDTHYGVYKTANEGTARIFATESAVNSIGLRPYVVYGVGRDRGMTAAPTESMLAAVHGPASTIPFGGRGYLHSAPDVAAAFIAAARTGFNGATVLNIPGTSVLIDEVVAEIERAIPEAAGLIEFGGPALPFPAELDSHEFAGIVGDVPVTALAHGVAETIRHFRG